MRPGVGWAAFALFALLLAPAGSGETPTPAPTPKGKPARKLSGGSFGQPPATTPTARPDASGSLADVVRKTQEDSTAPGTRSSRSIVITNETLGKPSATPASASISIVGRAGGKPVVRTPATPTPAPAPIPEYRDASGRTEAEWRERAGAARGRLEAADNALTSAQAEARRLENDFYAWSDGNYRERVIRPAWDQARERAANLEREVEAARRALDELEDEARRSGTPPGWLR